MTIRPAASRRPEAPISSIDVDDEVREGLSPRLRQVQSELDAVRAEYVAFVEAAGRAETLASGRIHDLVTERDAALDQLTVARTEVVRLAPLAHAEYRLTAALLDVDRLQHRLATTESNLRQREEEVAQGERALAEADARSAALGEKFETLAQQVSARNDTSQAANTWLERIERFEEISVLTVLLRQRDEEIVQGQSALAAALAEASRSDSDLRISESRREQQEVTLAEMSLAAESTQVQLAERLYEIVKLTALLRQHDGLLEEGDKGTADMRRIGATFVGYPKWWVLLRPTIRRRREIAYLERMGLLNLPPRDAEWLHRLEAAVADYPRWWAALPSAQRLRREQEWLGRRGLFNAKVYMERYPDVAQKGAPALRHYLLHGIREGRARPS